MSRLRRRPDGKPGEQAVPCRQHPADDTLRPVVVPLGIRADRRITAGGHVRVPPRPRRLAQAHRLPRRNHAGTQGGARRAQMLRRLVRLPACRALGGQVKYLVAYTLSECPHGGVQCGHRLADAGRRLCEQRLPPADVAVAFPDHVLLLPAHGGVGEGCPGKQVAHPPLPIPQVGCAREDLRQHGNVHCPQPLRRHDLLGFGGRIPARVDIGQAQRHLRQLPRCAQEVAEGTELRQRFRVGILRPRLQVACRRAGQLHAAHACRIVQDAVRPAADREGHGVRVRGIQPGAVPERHVLPIRFACRRGIRIRGWLFREPLPSRAAYIEVSAAVCQCAQLGYGHLYAVIFAVVAHWGLLSFCFFFGLAFFVAG